MKNRIFNKPFKKDYSENRSEKQNNFKQDYRQRASKNDDGENYLLYGKHPVLLAIKNPNRKIFRVLCTKNSLNFLQENLSDKEISKLNIEVLDPQKIDKLFYLKNSKEEVTHQGLVAEVEVLSQPSIEDVSENYNFIVALDKITDPHNVGAIIRSAKAFGADCVISKDKNSPPENATIAKTSAGYIESVAYARFSSLSKSLEYLKEQGFIIVGLSGKAEISVNKFTQKGNICLVVGSEGKGISENIQALCDYLVKVEISDAVESLNASVATAIALHSIKINNFC
ncbi:MAG: 23S rRNA (guanosine(2251)-2'-O)-methyltransferase RlmB [Rickettsiales bacterium]|nr:23S rRNA (guanosine(2251)-2'-O)-methyltransferase RlmB [Rickettsiales bacterium]